MEKIRRTTFRKRLDQMVTALRNEILTGKKAPGEFLKSETALGEQYLLSKNSVRKGLDMLVSEKLIEKVPRVGNRVCNPNSEGSVTVRLGYYPSLISEVKLDHLISDFHLKHPHIRVQLIPIYYGSFYETVTDSFQNDLLDAVTLNYNNFFSILDGGKEHLLEVFESNPDVYSFLNRAFTHKDRLYIQPLIFSPVVLCYNKNHFTEKQIPEPDSSWTWDELLKHAVLLSDEKERYGFYFHLLSDNRWPIFMLQSGMKMERNDKGRFRVCETSILDSMQVCRDLVYEQGIFPAYFSESDSDAEALFLQGKISMIMSTYFSLNSFRDADFPFEIAPLPYLYSAKTLLVTIGIAINRNSKVKEAAKTLVEHLQSSGAQHYIRQNTLSIPSVKKAAEWQGKESSYRPSRFHMYRDIVPTYALFSDLNLSEAEFKALRQELKLFWSKMIDKQELCENLERNL
jgi:multiple sugar transport system substrate-binding protein